MSEQIRRPHRRLLRRWMIDKLGRISKKWPKLSYPEFCVKAEAELNPERSDNILKNFSELESIAGYIQKYDERILFVDQNNRPDLYVRREYRKHRSVWNRIAKNTLAQLYVVPYMGLEYRDKAGKKYKRAKEVFYDYLQTLRGRNRVTEVDRHLDNTGNGVQETRTRISESVDVRRVDKNTKILLQEFARRHGR